MAKTSEASNQDVVVKRVIPAKREKVYDAWTQSDIMEKWFFPVAGWTAKASNELKVKGTYRLEMLENDKPSGECYLHEGEYLELVKPEKIVFTWNSPLVKDSVVTVDLKDLGDSTEVTITHRLLPDEETRQKHNGGWLGCLDNLGQFLK